MKVKSNLKAGQTASNTVTVEQRQEATQSSTVTIR